MHSSALELAAAALACVALVGCAGSGAISPTATADLQKALAAGCPVLAAIQKSGLPLNKYQTAAINTLALACPPNPPPTSAIAAVEDIVAAYATLAPLLKR